GTTTRPQIAGHADFDRNLALGQLFDQFWIFLGSQAVADAFRLEIQRAPNRLRPSAFTGVRRQMKPVFRGASVNSREPLRRPGTLITANAERHHVAIAKLDSKIEHALRLLR